MNDRALIRTGTAGATVAAICCAMPVLAVLLPLVGLSAWMARADLVLFRAHRVGRLSAPHQSRLLRDENHEEGLKQ